MPSLRQQHVLVHKLLQLLLTFPFLARCVCFLLNPDKNDRVNPHVFGLQFIPEDHRDTTTFGWTRSTS